MKKDNKEEETEGENTEITLFITPHCFQVINFTRPQDFFPSNSFHTFLRTIYNNI